MKEKILTAVLLMVVIVGSVTAGVMRYNIESRNEITDGQIVENLEYLSSKAEIKALILVSRVCGAEIDKSAPPQVGTLERSHNYIVDVNQVLELGLECTDGWNVKN